MPMPQLNIHDMIRFSRLMLQFQSIERAIHLPGRTSRENDVEHSYQLAMMAWYLNSSGELGYDTDKIIRYALVHDLAETYAGDINAYDAPGRIGKAQRERRALEVMLQSYPGASELIAAVCEYDRLEDAEARFIYALDKLMPEICIYLEGGQSWRNYQLTPQAVRANKLDKVSLSSPIKDLYDQLSVLLERNPQLFSAV